MMNGEFSNATNSKGIIKSVVVFIKHFISRLKNDIILVPAVSSTDWWHKKYAVLSEYHSIYLLIFLVSQLQLFGQK